MIPKATTSMSRKNKTAPTFDMRLMTPRIRSCEFNTGNRGAPVGATFTDNHAITWERVGSHGHHPDPDCRGRHDCW